MSSSEQEFNQQYENRMPKPEFPAKEIGAPPGKEYLLEPQPRFKGKFYKSAEKLKDKVALITGGDSGIGKSVAYLYAREGAKVAFTYLPQEKRDAVRTRGELEEIGADCMPIECDLTETHRCNMVVEKVVEAYGRIDILVNNAAFQTHVKDPLEVSLDQWDRTFKTNIYAPFFLTKAALPHMQAGSCVINTGSLVGENGSSGLLDYSSTKGAVHAFTKSLAQNLVEKGIRVNAVAPGPVWTPLNPSERPKEETKSFGKKNPMGRPAQPEEIAPAYVYLASQADSGYVTGEILHVFGGVTT